MRQNVKGWAAMKNPELFEQARLRMQERVSSPEYRKAVERFTQEQLCMEQLAQELEAKLPAIRSLGETETVRTEYASGSNLHRGFYCPSPILDFVTGNTHRGKLLKQVTSRSRPSHEYGFSSDGRLLWCKCLQNSIGISTEYLIRDGELVLGIMHDGQGDLTTITKEIYQEGRLQSYIHSLFLPGEEGSQCLQLTIEDYNYDKAGLHSCQWHDYMAIPKRIPDAMRELMRSMPFLLQPVYRHEEYVFERTEGFLSSYRNQGRLYTGRTKLLANPVPQISGIILTDIKE